MSKTMELRKLLLTHHLKCSMEKLDRCLELRNIEEYNDGFVCNYIALNREGTAMFNKLVGLGVVEIEI